MRSRNSKYIEQIVIFLGKRRRQELGDNLKILVQMTFGWKRVLQILGAEIEVAPEVDLIVDKD